MYTLQRYNVVKKTDSEVKRDKYLSEGFELIEQPAEPLPDNPEGAPESKPAKKGKADE
jgi:hypothetical protein